IVIHSDKPHRKGNVETTILHEILHALTYSELRKDSQKAKDFEKLYNQAINNLDKDSFYGLSNKDEFIVALFTDSGLINALKEIPPVDNIEYKNLFEEIYDFILSLLGINKKDNLYEQAFSLATNIINDFSLEQSWKNYYSDAPLEAQVEYTLKSVEILLSDKAKQVFDKGKKNGWDLNKILTELQVPKEQKQLILDLGITDREQIALELANQYSYTVEINTAKTEGLTNWRIIPGPGGEGANWVVEWTNNQDGDIELFDTEQEARNFIKNKQTVNENTQYYSNLTVPGGTNYTENEIAIPAITPSIKGHAQFATDNGIGWFRSDEQVIGGKEVPANYEQSEADIEEGIPPYAIGTKTEGGTPTKTRRILEIQSDLFQKGRGKENLIGASINNKKYVEDSDLIKELNSKLSDNPFDTEVILNGKKYDREGLNGNWFIVGETKKTIYDYQNQFLQLLNKDNNWVTFFVKSIIQDSAKKGYEKVLFPKGDTAAKIEGHQTLEEFKKQKEDRIKELEDKVNKNWGLVDAWGNVLEYFNTEKEANEKFRTYNNSDYGVLELNKIGLDAQKEINQLKQELERVEREGFGALKPIYNFYENTVTNILKKQGYNPVEITDEYGNTWNEIEIKPEHANNILFSKYEDKKPSPIKIGPQATPKKVFDKAKEFLNRTKIPLDLVNLVYKLDDVRHIVNGIDIAVKLGNSILSEKEGETIGVSVVSLLGSSNYIYQAMYNQIVNYPHYAEAQEAFEGHTEDVIRLQAIGALINDFARNYQANKPYDRKSFIWVREMKKYFAEKFKNTLKDDFEKQPLDSMLREASKLPLDFDGSMLEENVSPITKTALMKEFRLPARPVSDKVRLRVIKDVKRYNALNG
ncbi:MAG TPA: hypothetical protein VIK84_00320, partial [Haloplasmataceae bacterium]